MVWRAEDPQGNEAQKVKWDIVPYTRGRGLDVGCGPNKAFPHFIGVDNGKDTELFGIRMKPDITIQDCADLSLFGSASMDFVFSSHLLEHVEDPILALKEWWRVLKLGGYLVLYLPHKDFYPNIGTKGANPDHKHDFVPDDIVQAMHQIQEAALTDMWLLVNEPRNDGMEYSFFQVYRKGDAVDKPTFYFPAERPVKSACVVRYGGFGDQIQASNILPELKRQGYHVTFMTTPKGMDIIKHDPHVDEFFLQDNDQVPNHELMDFWDHHMKRFDKWINLSESIEGTLLAMPGRANHLWPPAVRSKHLNQNYLEWTSELAELPYQSEAKFYASAEEKISVAKILQEVTTGRTYVYTILWVLSGSSVHKFYPHQDSVIAKILLKIRSARIILVGDEACQILEAGWENEKRVHRYSSKISIRETLALAQCVDLVIGPETGVLNAVAFEPNVGKIVMLSHSSVENLTKHWVSAISLTAPGDASIKPCGLIACHQLHYGRDYCPEDEESGAAMCQVRISPDAVFNAVMILYREKSRFLEVA